MIQNHPNRIWSSLMLSTIGLIYLVTMVQCVPVEIIYTGEGCECPTKLDYRVNVPKIPPPKKYIPCEHGYKIDIPVQAKACLSYSFDVTVEEPRTPKPPKQTKWNLYAKVDRITVNKGDCEDTYSPPSPPPCSCGQCDSDKPVYRYVYKKIQACKCKKPNCRCNIDNAIRDYDDDEAAAAATSHIAAIHVPRTLPSPTVPTTLILPANYFANTYTMGHHMRRKRDLQRAFFRSRRTQDAERPGRFRKLYNKSLDDPKKTSSFFGLDRLFFDTPLMSSISPSSSSSSSSSDFESGRYAKRKSKKFLWPQQQQRRLVKRDIKGEYDLLEKERAEMDLTLPEIIQFMPETLQPNFKRGPSGCPCNFGVTPCPGCALMHEQRAEHEAKQSQERREKQQYSITESRTVKETLATIAEMDAGGGDVTGARLDSRDGNRDGGALSSDNGDRRRRIGGSGGDDNDHDDDDDGDMNDMSPVKSAYTSPTPHNSPNSISSSSSLSSSSLSKSSQSSYRKRNADNYDAGIPAQLTAALTSADASINAAKELQQQHQQQQQQLLPSYVSENAYNAPLQSQQQQQQQQQQLALTQMSTSDPIILATPATLPPHSAYLATSAAPMLSSASTTGTSSAPTPPIGRTSTSAGAGTHSSADGGLPRPIYLNSQAQLDRVISDIVYRHPDFIDATSHYGGSITDSEVKQKSETQDLLKRLIDGRLRMWFGEDDDPINAQYNINPYMTAYNVPHLPPPTPLVRPPPTPTAVNQYSAPRRY